VSVINTPSDQPISEIIDSEIIIIDPTPEPEPTSETSPIEDYSFTVNVEGDMHDKSFFTISGTVPDEPRHLTGMIYSEERSDLKIVYVFQIQLDDGVNEYHERVGINDDFIWVEDTTYIVSVNHGKIIKKIEFYRGTTENNFLDSQVPLTNQS